MLAEVALKLLYALGVNSGYAAVYLHKQTTIVRYEKAVDITLSASARYRSQNGPCTGR